MQIFLTGATGFVGQNLLARLLNEGHSVNILVRDTPKAVIYHHRNVNIFQGDLRDRETIFKAVHGCEEVYHVAGYARVWAKDPAMYFRVNVEGTVNVLDAALHHNVRRVVFTSTGATYGASNGKPICEENIRLTDFFTEYESSKFMAEQKVLEYVLKGLDVVIVQPLRIYGPGVMSESNPISHIIKSYICGEWHVIPGNGTAISSFVYIDDVVEGHLLAMRQGRTGERYILGGVNTNSNHFFSVLADLSGKKYFLFRIPMPAIMAFAWKEELAARWFKVAPLITPKWLRKYNLDMACSSEKAVRELGYRITPLEDGIRKTLDWLQEKYHLYF